MSLNEKTIKQIVSEVLAEMKQEDCNTPVVGENQTIQTLDGVTTLVPTWEVIFSCENPEDENNRIKAKLSIETPPEKTENQVIEEIREKLKYQLRTI